MVVEFICNILAVYASIDLGPDAQETVYKSVGGVKLTFFASELRLRGDAYISQPHKDEQGNILCWNGEVSLFLITNTANMYSSDQY